MPTLKQQAYRGSCLCGQVTFEAGGFSDKAAACHCTMCRKFHGAAFGSLVDVDEFSWLSGEQLLRDYRANNGTVRTFCGECGASLGFRSSGAGMDNFEVAIACFDEEIPVVLDAHIYTNYKACWYKVTDDLVTHTEGRE